MDLVVFPPNRLDGLIHIEMFNYWQRQEKVSISLHSKCSRYFFLQPRKSCFHEFGYRTMDYNGTRDLVQLRNEVVLINIAETEDSI